MIDGTRMDQTPKLIAHYVSYARCHSDMAYRIIDMITCARTDFATIAFDPTWAVMSPQRLAVRHDHLADGFLEVEMGVTGHFTTNNCEGHKQELHTMEHFYTGVFRIQ